MTMTSNFMARDGNYGGRFSTPFVPVSPFLRVNPFPPTTRFLYFPIQNRSKICASRSSVVRAADELIESLTRGLQVGQDKFFRHRRRRLSRVDQILARGVEQGDVPRVGDRGGIAQ
jgi:hypothetical protein